jgi:membrane associated rhomboid family serine protease
MFMRTVAYTPKGISLLKVQDYGLALYAKVPGLANAEFLGALGTWWPIPKSLAGSLPQCQGGCGYGICVSFETCHCLPSYTGRQCTTPIPMFKSVGSHLPLPKLSKTKAMLETTKKLGIPDRVIDVAQEGIEGFVRGLGAVTVLELIMILMVALFVAGTVFGSPSRLVRSRFSTFTSSSLRDFNPVGILLSNFMHSSILELFLNLIFYWQFAPAAYSRLGERKFTYLVACCCFAAQACSLLWRKLSGSPRRATVGASGWIVGLESYVLAGQAAQVAWAGGDSMFVLKESIVRHLFLDFLIGGWRADFSAMVGGFVGGVVFSTYVEPLLLKK